ncbi:cytochrome c family protein [Bradyrhizobium sp. Leo121]|uniref:c-type cytochrome n=1 Tax=Bradyrhizobium sp. Leo121 TaxID=1571195 RepID=UPI0010298209|nr:cytochrome c family protein [Bradyrhizobium sp. Leo121]RZN33739.1 cytochrome c family protein [Bradyrhizobium sp. Leo121]
MRTVHQIIAIGGLLLTVSAPINSANAAGDATKGELVFAKCAPCHAKDKSNRMGPGLLGVLGRHAGSLPGFHYSRAMKAASIVWDDKSLDAFIAAPQKAVPGTVMPFAGIADQQQRTDLIAYLETLK